MKSFLDELLTNVIPKHYKKKVEHSLPEGYHLYRRGAYIFLAMPYADVPNEDFGSSFAKRKIRDILTCIPFIAEKGLFLLYYGDSSNWIQQSSKYTVDKTALRPVILQCVAFLDPETGENTNTRTHWGPVKFGFCGGLLDDIESTCQRSEQVTADKPLTL